MKKQRTHYEKSFKENAIKLSKDRKNVSELAHELGIEPFLLYRWRKEFQENGESAFSGKGNAILSEEHKKIIELQKSLREVEIDNSVTSNLLNREFKREKPMEACVLDLFDCELIGWSMSDNMSASNTVIPAIRMANRSRALTDRMIFHSDRGVQYACKQTSNILNATNVRQSMSRKGNCWDKKGLRLQTRHKRTHAFVDF
jgi:transposase-like protein